MTQFKKHVVTLAKVVIPLVIIFWLLSSIEREQLHQLQERSKDWGRLALAFGIILVAVITTFIRWFLLVRMLHLPFRLRDAFRLGFLAFLLNFISVGAVGGDLFKAFFIARDQPGRRTEAVATVVVDRLVGFYALLIVGSVAILSAPPSTVAVIQAIRNSVLAVAAVATVGLIVVLLPGFTQGSVAEFLMGLPRVGGIVQRLVASLRMYRRSPWGMAAVFALALSVQAMLAVSLYCIASGLSTDHPTLAEHFIIVPLSNVAAGVPFTPAGLGTFEFAMDALYTYIPAPRASGIPGVLVALAFRLITIAVAGVGVVYYWTSRAEIQRVMDEAEHSQLASEESTGVA